MPLKADRTTALNKLQNDLKNEIANSTSYLNDAKMQRLLLEQQQLQIYLQLGARY